MQSMQGKVGTPQRRICLSLPFLNIAPNFTKAYRIQPSMTIFTIIAVAYLKLFEKAYSIYVSQIVHQCLKRLLI